MAGSLCWGGGIAFADSPSWVNPCSSSSDFVVNTATARLDSDGDGMLDAWESAHGLNPNLDDRALDPDNDGASNITEYNRGTDPHQSDLGKSESRSSLFSLILAERPTDTDGDGMPDAWESAHGLNPLVADSGADADGDGLSNIAEYNAGLDPQSSELRRFAYAQSRLFIYNSGGFPLGYLADTDGDGMPDWWEVAHGLNPSVLDANSDPDGDGWTNLEEFQRGTRPEFDETTGGTWALSWPFLFDTANRPIDTDHDGIPDWWEISHGLNPNLPDAALDPDGDGRFNLAEYNAGTDPQVDDWRGPSRTTSVAFTTDTGGFWGPFTLDSDHDGMPDWWELLHGFNPNFNDALGDADGDRIANGLEYLMGLNPYSSETISGALALSGPFHLRTIRDDDHDGMDDDWETRYFGVAHPIATADADGDGLSNFDEFRAGTSPVDAGSTLVLYPETSPSPGGKQIRWQSAQYRTYAVERSTNFLEGFNQIIANDLPATPPLNTYRDTTATNAGPYFYRVRVIVLP